jgi:hypothetical protein
MMTIPTEVAKSVVDSLKSTPVLLGLMLINILVLVGFTFTLREVAKAAERKDAVIQACLERRP